MRLVFVDIYFYIYLEFRVFKEGRDHPKRQRSDVESLYVVVVFIVGIVIVVMEYLFNSPFLIIKAESLSDFVL